MKKIVIIPFLLLVNFLSHGQKLMLKDSTILCDSIFVKYKDYLDEWGEICSFTYSVDFFDIQVKVNADVDLSKLKKKRHAIKKPKYEYFLLLFHNGNTSTLGIMTNGNIKYNGVTDYRLNKSLLKILRSSYPNVYNPKKTEKCLTPG